MLVITSLTEECHMHHVKNLCEGRGSCGYGPPGSGKTETIIDLAILLGQNIIRCDDVKDLTQDDLHRLFKGSILSNSLIVLDEFNTLGEQEMANCHQIMTSVSPARVGNKIFVA